MKIQLLARPDHALYLYDFLKRREEVQMLNFNVAKKGSLLHKLYPHAKLVDDEVRVLNDLTIADQLIFRLGRTGIINPYKWESRYSEYAYARTAKNFSPDIIHYWPVYCHKYVKKKRSETGVTTVADVFCAHPYHILDILRKEYDTYNMDIKKSYFYIDAERMIAFLTHEKNIITNSQYVKESLLQYAPDKNTYAVDYGFLGVPDALRMYESARQATKINPGLHLVYVGTVSIEKGVPYLLEAIKKLNSSAIHLDIIGPVNPAQEKIFKAYRSIPGINFLGPKPNAVVKKLLPAYSALVLPSLSDANSIAVIEALQNSLPVIVTENTGNKDVIRKYHVGEIVPAADVDALVNAMEKMIDTEHRRMLSENIRNFILEDASYPYPQRVLDIYHSLLSNSKTI